MGESQFSTLGYTLTDNDVGNFVKVGNEIKEITGIAKIVPGDIAGVDSIAYTNTPWKEAGTTDSSWGMAVDGNYSYFKMSVISGSTVEVRTTGALSSFPYSLERNDIPVGESFVLGDQALPGVGIEQVLLIIPGGTTVEFTFF